MDRFITVAIHTYNKAVALRSLLESEGIQVEFRNVNIEHPTVSSGVRVRIRETDLPLALRIIENREIFDMPSAVAEGGTPEKSILVPVDFSEHSLKAAMAAFALAEIHKTSIMLLHTYIDPYVAGNMQLTDSLTYEISDMSARQQIETTADTQMRHFAARLRELIKKGEIAPVKFKTSVMEGVPEDAIAEYAREHNPFMIVMGTRGPKKKEMDMIGSVTAEVLDKCRNMVLAIPEFTEENAKGRTRTFKNIIFFGNLDQQDILALDTLCRVYPGAGAKVTIVSLPAKKRAIMRNTTDAINAICDYCNQNIKGYEFEVASLDSENVADDIRRLKAEKQFDLIVVPNKKKGLLARFFSPTLAHRILFASETPMLVIPV